MALFKIAIRYSGSSSEEIISAEAKTVSQAKSLCSSIMENDAKEVERLAKLNVYISKQITSCRMCEQEIRIDMLGIEELLGLKNDI